MVSEVVQAIKLVPDVIWSGVIAAFIALCGVWLSNRSNNQRLSLQLAHDLDEKSKERVFKLRSEVYLNVAECIELTNIHLSTMSTRDITTSDMSPELERITSAMSKLKIVAGPETSKLAGELGLAFGTTFMAFLSRMRPLHETKIQIEINDGLYQEYLSESRRLQKEINEVNERGTIDYLRFQSLQASFKSASDQMQYYADERLSAHAKYSEKLKEFNILVLPAMKYLSELQLKLMVSTRSDLGLESNLKELHRQLETQWAAMNAAYGEIMSSLEE